MECLGDFAFGLVLLGFACGFERSLTRCFVFVWGVFERGGLEYCGGLGVVGIQSVGLKSVGIHWCTVRTSRIISHVYVHEHTGYRRLYTVLPLRLTLIGLGRHL